jgi:hypothetical protein
LNGDRRYSLEFVWISWYISYRYAANRFLFVFFFCGVSWKLWLLYWAMTIYPSLWELL